MQQPPEGPFISHICCQAAPAEQAVVPDKETPRPRARGSTNQSNVKPWRCGSTQQSNIKASNADPPLRCHGLGSVKHEPVRTTLALDLAFDLDLDLGF